jgi:hypothetical protein
MILMVTCLNTYNIFWIIKVSRNSRCNEIKIFFFISFYQGNSYSCANSFCSSFWINVRFCINNHNVIKVSIAHFHLLDFTVTDLLFLLQCGTTIVKTHTVQSGLLGTHCSAPNSADWLQDHSLASIQSQCCEFFFWSQSNISFNIKITRQYLKHFRLQQEPLHYKRMMQCCGSIFPYPNSINHYRLGEIPSNSKAIYCAVYANYVLLNNT